MSVPPLKDQTTCSGSFGQCLNSAMIKISTSIKDHLLNPLCQALLSHQFSNFLCGFHISWITKSSFQFRALGGGTDEGFPCRILNGLRINMLQTSEDIEARTIRRPLNMAPHLSRYSSLPTGRQACPALRERVIKLWSSQPSYGSVHRGVLFPFPCRVRVV